ncbi:hypothetical protein C0J52_18150, partial [Blattella germanica]
DTIGIVLVVTIRVDKTRLVVTIRVVHTFGIVLVVTSRVDKTGLVVTIRVVHTFGIVDTLFVDIIEVDTIGNSLRLVIVYRLSQNLEKFTQRFSQWSRSV